MLKVPSKRSRPIDRFNRRTQTKLAVLAGTALLAGCGDGTLGGQFTVDGKEGQVTSCRIGKSDGNAYREIINADGARLRITEERQGKHDNKLYEASPDATSNLQVIKCRSTSTSHSDLFGNPRGSAKLDNCRGRNIILNANVNYAKCTTAP